MIPLPQTEVIKETLEFNMTYKNKRGLIELLRKENLFSNNRLSQNFLVNAAIIKTIINVAGLTANDNVIEVGPGLGILTVALANKAGHVHAIELDRSLIKYLKSSLANFSNINLEQGNALKTKLPAVKYKLIANIPYHITSPLLTYFLHSANRPGLIVLLLQKEVAEKICAKEGSHSILSLNVQVFGRPSIITKVPKKDFYPEPKVDSAILKIEVFKNPLIDDLATFKKLISAAFSKKRKTLVNSISEIGIPKEKVKKILQKTGLEQSIRPQTLSVEQWAKLVETFKNLI